MSTHPHKPVTPVWFHFLLLVCLGPLSTDARAEFRGLGGLMPGAIDSIAMAISDDGSTVVGSSRSSSGDQAFRFVGGSMQPLGFIDGYTGDSTAFGVSADGTHVVGSSGSGFSRQEAFTWMAAGSMQGLGFLPGGRDDSAAFSVSSDGRTIVGRAYSEKGSEAFVTSPGNPLATLHTHRASVSTNSGALALSADGRIAAGFGNPSQSILAPNAFVWEGGGGTDLGTLPGVTAYSLVNALSPDGLHAVGWSASPEGVQAVLWSTGQPPRGLGDLPGGSFMSVARDVSADGTIVVGYSHAEMGAPEAFIWTEDTGMVRLADFLEVAGIDIAPWILVEACGISSDGTTIAGTGVNPDGRSEAWLVSLSTDADGDGISDDVDRFPHSDTAPTVMIAGKETGIPNRLLADGATLNDLINEAGSTARNKGQFSAAVSQLANHWVTEGYLSGKEKGRLQSAAAKVLP